MAGPGESAQDVAARDDAHLRSLGIKPELKRTLGFLSNFALAFSFISVSTGSFGNFGVGLGLGGPADLLDLADHRRRPVHRRARLRRAGEPLPGRRLDLPVVEAAVAPDARLVHRLVLLLGAGRDGDRRRGHRRLRRRRDPSAVYGTCERRVPRLARIRPASPRCSRSSRCSTLVITTLINAFGVRLLSILNNIGVATEILGMLVFALILLFFANHQSPSSADADVRRRAGAERQHARGVRARHVHGVVHPVRLRHRRDVRRGDGRRRAARRRAASFRRSLISGAVGAVFLLAVILSLTDIPAAMAEGQAGGFPIATTITEQPERRH